MALETGGLVVFATDTLYALGADATNSEAVAAVRRVKRRPAGDPLSVLAAPAMVPELVDVDDMARKALTALRWEPVTFLLRPLVRLPVQGDSDRLGIRLPVSPVSEKLAAKFVITATSANRHGEAAPSTGEEARAALGDDADVYLGCGPCTVRSPSTIIDLTGDVPRIVREGALAAATVRRRLS